MAIAKGLGQGVGLLFGEDSEDKFIECDITSLNPNKHQPRHIFNEEDLSELADSIREKGVIQPLIVKKSEDDPQKYDLIAGERRLRASKLAGLDRVPVVIREDVDEDSMLELAIIENVQRTDLNPVEEAQAYKKLIKKFGYTQEEAAQRVGKKRSTVTNVLRLLKLPKSIQADVAAGTLSEGHARALVKLVDSPAELQELRNAIIKNNLSVRQTERAIKKAITISDSKRKRESSKDQEIPQSYKKALVTQLTNRLNSKVSIQQNGARGKIEIEYYSLDDLDRVTSLLLPE